MLVELLKLMNIGKTLSSSVIAQKFDISVPFAEQLIQNLEDMGYVKHISFNCSSDNCSTCHLKNGCSSFSSEINILELTDKGKEMALTLQEET